MTAPINEKKSPAPASIGGINENGANHTNAARRWQGEGAGSVEGRAMNDIERGQLVKTTVECFRDVDGSLTHFPGLLKKIIEEQAWRSRVQYGKVIQLGSLRELVTRPPIEGWGQDPKKIEAIIKDTPEVLALWREAMKAGPQNQYTKCNLDNVKEATVKAGNSRAYAVSRLKAERADLFDAVCRGEMSANAAAIKAGFRKEKSPLDVLYSAWRKANSDQRKAFLVFVGKGGDQ